MKKTSNVQRPTSNVEVRVARALERIAASLEVVVDGEKRTLRMVDVDRANVYKTHLGKNLRKSAKSADKKGAAK
jgi:hypothetical protein